MALSKIDSDGIVSGGITADSLNIGQIGGRRNLIINGAMQVAQRGTSATGVTTNGYHTVDRWRTSHSATGLSHKVEQASDGPDGFAKSLKITATTQYTSPGAGDSLLYDTRFEGQDVQRLKFGTSNAQQVTLSFWVKASVTGDYAVMLRDQDNQRTTSKLYTVNAANTWEYKTITYDADTGGSGFTNDNSLAFRVVYILCAGSNYTSGTLATTWEANTNANHADGATNLLATLNATWQITGVQLEVGSVATPFEHRSFGEELALCQRYFQRYGQGSSSNRHFLATVAFSSSTDSAFIINLPTSMRAVPTLSFSSLQVLRGGVGYYSGTGTAINSSTPNEGVPINVLRFTQTTGSSGASQGDCGHIACAASTSSRLDLDAEL